MWAASTTRTGLGSLTNTARPLNYPSTVAPMSPITPPCSTQAAGQATPSPTGPLSHPAFSGPVRAQAIARPDDDEAATAETAGIMAAMIRQDSKDELVKLAAAAAVAGAAGQVERQIEAVFAWVKAHVRFREDSAIAAQLRGLALTPEDTEVLIRPADLLRMPEPAGDCDDFAMLGGAMLAALGIPVALVTIAADPAEPDVYTHVYLLAASPSGPIAVDASHGPRVGWQAPAAGKARIWEVTALTRQHPGLGVAIDWNAIIQTGVQAGAAIAKNVTLPSGFYQTGPQGTTYVQPAGSSALSFPTAQLTGGISTTMVVILVGAVALLLALRR